MTYTINLCVRNQSTGALARTDISNNVVNGFSFVEKLDDSLDVGTIVVRGLSKGTPYDMFDTIEVKIGTDVVYSQRIVGDKIRLISENPVLYEHTLSLVEHTKILERFLISGKTFTQPTDASATPRYYLYTVLTDLMNTVPLEIFTLYGSTRIHKLPTSGDLYDFLISEPSPEFTFKDITYLEALKQIGNYFDGIPRLFLNSSDELELTFDLVNEIKNLITTENVFLGKTTQQNAELYATQLESEALNLVNDADYGESTEIFPARNGFINYRRENDYYQGDYEESVLLTPKPIYAIPKIVFRVPLVVHNNSTGSTILDTTRDFNITLGIKEEKEYDLLDVEGSVQTDIVQPSSDKFLIDYKDTCIFYRYKQPNIIIGRQFGLWGVTEVVDNWVRRGIIQVLIDEGVIDGTINQLSHFYDVRIEFNPVTDEYDYKDYLFQIHYVPIPDNTRLNIDRQDLTDVSYNSALQSNQQARIINLENFTNNMSARLNRIGNSEMQLEHRATSLSNLYNIGDYTSELFIVTEKETIYFKDYIYAKYGLTKNFNKISEFIGVNSEYRAWEIGNSNILNRNLVYKEYIEIDAVSSGIGSNDSEILNTDGISTILDTFNPTSTYEAVSAGVFDGNETNDYVLLPLSSNGGGNSLIFSYKMLDNKSINFYKYEDTRTTPNTWVKNNIPYTDENGLMDNYRLYLINGISDIPLNETQKERSFNAGEKYPLLEPLLGETDGLDRVDTIYGSGLFKVEKDSREILGHTLQFQLISSNIENVILGRKLALRNRLVSETPPTSIKLYTSTTETLSRTSNFKLDTTNYLEKSSPTINISSANKSITVTHGDLNSSITSWVLTDENGYILIGVNQSGTLTNVLTFDFVNKRSGVKYKY